MTELIKIDYEKETPTVSGRDLHEFLEVETRYNDWFPRMCEYGFSEGADFYSILSESTGGRPATDHALSFDMAKELCMLARSDKGKQARRYFIQLEKAWNDPTAIMARALKLAQNRIDSLQSDNLRLMKNNEEMLPMAIFAAAVATSKTDILVGELAKVLRGNGISIGQNRLFDWLREKGYLIRRRGTDYNAPTQRSMELGLFRVKETAITRSDGSVSISRTSKVTGKGQQYFIGLFCGRGSADYKPTGMQT